MISSQTKTRGIPGKRKLYQMTAGHAQAAIDTIVELLQSRNENIRLGAAKALLNKSLPDLKAIELSGDESEPLKVVLRMTNNEKDSD